MGLGGLGVPVLLGIFTPPPSFMGASAVGGAGGVIGGDWMTSASRKGSVLAGGVAGAGVTGFSIEVLLSLAGSAVGAFQCNSPVGSSAFFTSMGLTASCFISFSVLACATIGSAMGSGVGISAAGGSGCSSTSSFTSSLPAFTAGGATFVSWVGASAHLRSAYRHPNRREGVANLLPHGRPFHAHSAQAATQ